MKITQECYNRHIQPYIDEGMDYEEDFDLVVSDLLKKAVILLGSIHDTINRNSEEENDLAKYKEIFYDAKSKLIQLNRIILAISHNNLLGIEQESDKLAKLLMVSGTSYYDENANIFTRITQISKFTNRNTLHSMVITAIAGERFNIDINIIRENILTMFLSVSRLSSKIEEDVTSNLDSSLLEILIYSASLNILFNVEQTELTWQ